MVELRNASSLLAVIREHARIRPDDAAVSYVTDPAAGTATTWTFAELDRRARRIASWLRERYGAGERVLLPYPLGLNFVEAFVGCLYAGMVAVPTPMPGRYHHERRRVSAICGNAAISVILTDSASEPGMREWLEASGRADLPMLATDTDGWGDPDAWVQPGLDRESLALLQYTSGSTGDPKGVMISHGNLLSNVESLRRGYGISDRPVFGGWIPLYHDMGLMGQLMPGILLGGSCVLMNPTAFLKRPHHWLKVIDRFGIEFSAAPNFAYEQCTRRITDEQLAEFDLSRWRYAANGSEPVHAATLAAFAERFAAAGFREDSLCPSYGMAEATVYVCSSRGRAPVILRVDAAMLERDEVALTDADVPVRQLVSCGPVADYTVHVVDPATGQAGQPLPPGRVGEIWLRGPSVSGGYWDNEPATERTFRARLADGDGDYLRTGDLGAVVDGELFVTGRIKETLIIHGRNLYPQDIEHELRAHHPELGQVGAVFTVPVGTGSIDEDVLVVTHEVQGRLAEPELRALALAMKQTVAREFGVRIGSVTLLRRGGVRRTTSGKIQRSAMRELYVARELEEMYGLDDPQLADVLRPRQPAPAGAPASSPVA